MYSEPPKILVHMAFKVTYQQYDSSDYTPNVFNNRGVKAQSIKGAIREAVEFGVLCGRPLVAQYLIR